MAAFSICTRWALGLALLLVSPALLIFAVPFATGATGDVMKLAGIPAGLAPTLAVCIGALVVAQRRYARRRRR